MTTTRFIWRSLVFYWRLHAGLFLGAALAAMILTGALTVGDSVRFSLRQIALSRLGNATLALNTPAHFMREGLAAQIEAKLGAPVAPLLMVRGTVSLPDGRARANEVQIVGVDERFWQIGGSADLLFKAGQDVFAANQRLAAQLGLSPGDAVVIRVEKPTLLSHEAPLSGALDASVAIRTRMAAVAGDRQFGRFSLQANQVSPLTVFIPLHSLQTALGQPGRANVLLASGGEKIDAARANAALREVWTLADLSLEVREVHPGLAELRTDRVFLEPPIAAVALKASPGAEGVLTYLVNEIRLGDHSTPYSMITATDAADAVPPMVRNEIAINSWLAEDLAAKPGDLLALRYFVLLDNGKLSEATSRFRVRSVLPLEHADASWMPPFQGLANVENCRDWEPGIPLDMSRIRPKDEEYWKTYRGTPKAFISLRAGQSLFQNRFGNLTAIRYPASADTIERAVRQAIDLKEAGLFFQPVREAAQAASGGSQDFGQLFAGFSFFLIVAALLLMAMLFAFSLEQRSEEAGILIALGFTEGRVRRLFLKEGYAVAALGTLAGIAAGAGYTRLALHGLSTIWRDAVNFSEFRYHAEPLTLLTGAGSSLVVGILVTWLAGRGVRPATGGRASRRAWAFGALCTAGAIVLLATGARSAEAFFEAGGLLLTAGITFSYGWLVNLSHRTGMARSLSAIGIRGATRRIGRSLTAIAVLASGIFMVVAAGAFRENPLQHSGQRASGTGGFALFGQSTLPIYEDLNSPEGRSAFGVTPQSTQGVAIVPMRMKEGDEASCRNLNRAQQPRFLGVQPQELASRKAFTFVDSLPGGVGWSLLDRQEPDGAVPAIGDEATVRWALGKSVGDTFQAIDEHGASFRVRIAGMISDSILQGSLVIGEKPFRALFPSSGGGRIFLIDAPQGNAGEVAKTLSQSLQGKGLEVVAAWRRLAEFQAVENSYLSIFQALGGLGLLLGSAGLGIVVMRNVFERRNELALLQAVGFSPRAVRLVVLSEHWLLIALGAGIGGAAAFVAILPSMFGPEADASWGTALVALGLLASGGAVWSWLAAWLALREPLLSALRNE